LSAAQVFVRAASPTSVGVSTNVLCGPLTLFDFFQLSQWYLPSTLDINWKVAAAQYVS
jgi:hypothetical protein